MTWWLLCLHCAPYPWHSRPAHATQGAVLNRNMRGVLYGLDARPVYPDHEDLRDMFEEVAVEHLNVSEQEAAKLRDKYFDFPVRSRLQQYAPKALHKKLRDPVLKLLDKVQVVATLAFFEEYLAFTGPGHYVLDKNEFEVLLFGAHDALKCFWENTFLNKPHGQNAMLAAFDDVCDKWSDIGGFFVPASATNLVEYYKVTVE